MNESIILAILKNPEKTREIIEFAESEEGKKLINGLSSKNDSDDSEATPNESA